jgi:hypothetical protein
MRENDFQRRRREREFQERVLSALEKPRENRFFKVINSPSFLWILTAVLLSLGGAFYSTRQQCIKDSDKITESLHKVSQEIESRLSFAYNGIDENSTFKSVKTALDHAPYRYSEFQSYTIVELYDRFRAMEWRVDSTVRNPDAFGPTHKLSDDSDTDRKLNLVLYALINDTNLFPESTPNDPQNMQSALVAEATNHARDLLNDLLFDFEPKCGVAEVSRAIVTGHQPYVVARRRANDEGVSRRKSK